MPHEQLRAAPLTDPAFHQVVDHPLMGPARYQTTPIRFAEPGVATIRRPTALLGEHDEAILREVLGLDDIGIAELRTCGVIGSGPTRPALERGQPTEGSQMP